MRVLLGYDSREDQAARVAAGTLRATSGVEAEFLKINRLREYGLFTRTMDQRGGAYDFISGAKQSTEFSLSRFLVPALVQSGWALFADSDVVFKRDVRELFALADERYAVMVVKHVYEPASGTKMDGQQQSTYPRKNWSSVILWNCSHSSNARLTIHDVNTRTGLYLHRFAWLDDSEIGALPAEWNILVGEHRLPRPEVQGILHFTRGGPWLAGWEPVESDHLWTTALKECDEPRQSDQARQGAPQVVPAAGQAGGERLVVPPARRSGAFFSPV